MLTKRQSDRIRTRLLKVLETQKTNTKEYKYLVESLDILNEFTDTLPHCSNEFLEDFSKEWDLARYKILSHKNNRGH